MGIQILARLAALLELALTATVVVQATPVQHVTQSVPILVAQAGPTSFDEFTATYGRAYSAAERSTRAAIFALQSPAIKCSSSSRLVLCPRPRPSSSLVREVLFIAYVATGGSARECQS
jgi:hypothetical protein